MKIGELIRQLRQKKGITQEDLAARTELSVRTIQRIEGGEVDPRAYTLQAIANALDVDFEIFSESEIRKDENNRWIPLLHLSGLLLLIIPPIILWIWKRDKVENIKPHAYDVINYQLSMSLYLLPFVFMSAYPIVLIIGIYSQIIIIMNTIKVAANSHYKYPLSIRFLR
jgi:transcriptional regulator with XRE-family HTH domain